MGLLVTLFCVFYVLILMIFKGTEPVIAAIIACALTTLVTLVLTSGFSNKTLAAILGTVLGMVTAAAFSFIISYFAKLTLLSDVQLNIKPKTECQPTHKTPPNETKGGVLLCTRKRR